MRGLSMSVWYDLGIQENHIHIFEEYDGIEVIRFCLYLQHDDHETASSGELGEQPSIDMDEKCWEPINSI